MWKVFAVLSFSGCALAMAATPVIHPREVIPNDPHGEHPLKLLALERGDPGVTLLWTMTDVDREA